MKTAIIYDYIPAAEGGGERALYELVNHFGPDVHLFLAFVIDSPYSRATVARFKQQLGEDHVHIGMTIRFLKPIIIRIGHYLLPALLQKYNLQSFDLVMSFTAFLSHSIVPPVRGRHILFMNTPARFIWNLPHAFSVLKVLTSPMLITDVMQFRSRMFDLDGIEHVSEIWSNSHAVAERIHTFYNREAKVLYPPSIPDSLLKQRFDSETITEKLGNYLIYMGRVESFKNLDLLVDAYEQKTLPPDISAVIIGDGPYLKQIRKRIRKIYGAPTRMILPLDQINAERYGSIYVTGYLREDQKLTFAAAAKGFLSLNDEDFGITKIEALAVGIPIVAWQVGGAREVVKEGTNGIFFAEPTAQALGSAVSKLLNTEFHRPMIRHTAQPFTTTAFHVKLDKLLYA